MIQRLSLVIFCFCLLTSCSRTRPCSDGGDISWPTPIHGDSFCHQVKDKDGKYVNNGEYIKYYPNGKVALKGDFIEGKRDGVWTQYDETGKKKVEKYFENDVEVSAPVKSGSR